jgi:hypothetical protein
MADLQECMAERIFMGKADGPEPETQNPKEIIPVIRNAGPPWYPMPVRRDLQQNTFSRFFPG